MKNHSNSYQTFNKASTVIALSIILGTVTYAWTGPGAMTPQTGNTPAPINVSDNEQTKGGPVLFNGSYNPIRISSNWSGFTINDSGTPSNHAEIANDTIGGQALMIAGNKSAGGLRKIKLYDNVDISSHLTAASANFSGSVTAGKVYSAPTTDADSDSSLVTKGYLGNKLGSIGSAKVYRGYFAYPCGGGTDYGIGVGIFKTDGGSYGGYPTGRFSGVYYNSTYSNWTNYCHGIDNGWAALGEIQ